MPSLASCLTTACVSGIQSLHSPLPFLRARRRGISDGQQVFVKPLSQINSRATTRMSLSEGTPFSFFVKPSALLPFGIASSTHPLFTLPSLSNVTPSDSRIDLFLSISGPHPHFPENPPIRPSDAMTRCHGTAGAKGFRRIAPPTDRALERISAAMTPYDATAPGGIR